MWRVLRRAQPVVPSLPEAPAERRRVAAWLGVLSCDLERLFDAGPHGVPLASEEQETVAAATVADLVATGLPAELAPAKTRLDRATGVLLRVGLLSAIVCGIGNVMVDGLEPLLVGAPDSLLIFGLILPTALSGFIAGGALPAWLVTSVISILRRRTAALSRSEAGAVAVALAERGVTGRAAEVDAHARQLARRVVRTAHLTDSVAQDLLAAVDACRMGLRQVASAPDVVLDATESELGKLEQALDARQTADVLARDVSAPLAGLRAAAEALARG